jgi:hypothetical protein
VRNADAPRSSRTLFGERAVLKLMYAALIRAAERWRGLRMTEFERRQLIAIRNELDRAHAERTAPAVNANVTASPTRYPARVGLDLIVFYCCCFAWRSITQPSLRRPPPRELVMLACCCPWPIPMGLGVFSLRYPRLILAKMYGKLCWPQVGSSRHNPAFKQGKARHI